MVSRPCCRPSRGRVISSTALVHATALSLLLTISDRVMGATFPSLFTGGGSFDARYNGPWPPPDCPNVNVQGGVPSFEIIERDTCYVHSRQGWQSPPLTSISDFFPTLGYGTWQNPTGTNPTDAQTCNTQVNAQENQPIPWAPNPLGVRRTTYSSACTFASPGCSSLLSFPLDVSTACANSPGDFTWGLFANGCPAGLYGACTPVASSETQDGSGCGNGLAPAAGQVKVYPTLKCGYVRWDASLVQLLGTDTIALVTDPAGNQYLQHAAALGPYTPPPAALYPPGWTLSSVNITELGGITIAPLRKDSSCAGVNEDIGDASSVGCVYMLLQDGAANAYHRILWTGREPVVLVQARNGVPFGEANLMQFGKAAAPNRPAACRGSCGAQAQCTTGACDACVAAAASLPSYLGDAAAACVRCQTGSCWDCVRLANQDGTRVSDVRQCTRCRTGDCFSCLRQVNLNGLPVTPANEFYCAQCTSSLCTSCVTSVAANRAQYCPYVMTGAQLDCVKSSAAQDVPNCF